MNSASITDVRSAITSGMFTFINGEVDDTLANVIAVGKELGYKVAHFDLAVTTFEELESVQNFLTDTFIVEHVLPDSIKDADLIVFTNMDLAMDDALSFSTSFQWLGTGTVLML